MNFKQLEAFYWLSQLRNYRQTAEFLSLTQPAVSARIQSLEKDLGKTLIDREAASFALTDQGIEVAEFAVQFLNLREAMMGRLQDKRKRRLSIGLAGMAAFTFGPLLRDAVAEADPDLLLDIYAGSDMQLRGFIASGTLDAAFTASGDRAPDSDFAVRYTVGWVARPDVIAGRDLPMTPEDLRTLPLVLYPKTSPLFNPVAQYVDEMRERPAARHYGNSLATICEMLRQGYGASALALTPLERDIAQGRLVEIPATEPIPALEVACTHVNRARRKQVGAVLDLAREAARNWCAGHEKYASFVTR
ncbi:MAG: LysR family transcriptional regulator [Rhodobacteraceae bacterium]|jgi:DNA-binding transcriptional LysR family regulator|uniref:Transcriptional regulator n=1 Tax=Salipiger profundus TaxID=1229727 RepID=A0A1U7D7P7_9RHOB|nr:MULTISPECIES: LysR family transcriptional regulator [Salipiger]APX24132.1 transcriptional regulator [Salipiger profundus]MAB06919.1 LysR family transcriptional regulator [Paracoccaceae bacterium]GFZ94839.1 LysR family transcriptional regulator [Salipiger profundus]SFB90183.1 DNA-binding transcriptional regulator, LysR family [Salipiger profundus]